MKSTEYWSSPISLEDRDDPWGSAEKNLRAPILPVLLGEHLIALGDDHLEQARILSFYSTARNSDALGLLTEYIATFDLPLLLKLYGKHLEGKVLDGVDVMNSTMESPKIPEEVKGVISPMLEDAMHLSTLPMDEHGITPYDPYNSLIDSNITPPIHDTGEEWERAASSQSCAIILSIAMFQSHLRHLEAQARGGYSEEELGGLCSREEEKALEQLALTLWSRYTDSGDHNDGFFRNPEHEAVYGTILSRVGTSMLDLLPLALLAQEYNWEWATAAFDWGEMGSGEMIHFSFME